MNGCSIYDIGTPPANPITYERTYFQSTTSVVTFCDVVFVSYAVVTFCDVVFVSYAYKSLSTTLQWLPNTCVKNVTSIKPRSTLIIDVHYNP